MGLGCGRDPPGEDPEGGPQVQGAAVISPEEGPGDTVVIALRRLPTTFDPLAELDPWGQRVVDDLLMEGLVRRSGRGAPWAEPALAERCEGAGGAVTCWLREGSTFHDGAPVTPDDVGFSVGLWLGPRAQAARQRHGLDNLRAVEVRGREVQISFDPPEPLALEKLAAVKIVPRARYNAGKFATSPIGSGPYRLVPPEEGEAALVFEASEPTPGRARRVVLRAMEDGAAALTALRRGEIDLLAEVAAVHVPKELAKPAMASRFVAYVVSPPRYDLLLFNLHEGVQAGSRMRQALDLAIPRAELARQVYGVAGQGLAAPVDLREPRPLDLAALDAAAAVEALDPWIRGLDPSGDAAAREQAALILSELGWIHERGVRRRATATLRLPLTWDGSSGAATGVVRALRAGWKEVGVLAPSVTASWPYVLANLLRPAKFSVALARLSGGSDLDLYPWFHSKGAHNITGISDAILDAALASYRGAETREARDAAKRAIAERLATVRPVVVLHAPVSLMLSSRAVTDLEFIDDLPRLDRLGIAAGPRSP